MTDLHQVSDRPTRATDPTLPITLYDPIYDDNPILLALVPGDWPRGRAFARVADDKGVPFTSLRARRVYLRWSHGVAWPGWSFDDGALIACDKTDPWAERYWEITQVNGFGVRR